MIPESERQRAAGALLDAYSSGVPISPLTDTHPDLSVDDAYAIQAVQVRHWLNQGSQVRGYKVGLTSKAMQEQLGVDQPDYGFLVDGMLHDSGATLNAEHFISPKIEPEIAFILNRAVKGPGLALAELEDAIEWVLPSLEIIDTRITDWRIRLADTIADNASSAAVVLGTSRKRLSEVDVENTTVSLLRGGELLGTGTGAAVMGSPLNAALWLANRLGELGVELAAGALLLPGSVCAAIAVKSGDHIQADFGALGSVDLTFSEVVK